MSQSVGVPSWLRGESRPIEPDPGHTGVGNGTQAWHAPLRLFCTLTSLALFVNGAHMAFQALTIAGSDSGGGAGVQADLKTFSALSVYGASVLTAITAQNTRVVTAVEPVSPTMIRAQMAAVFDDLEIGAVKIGMLGGPGTINAVAEGLARCTAPMVLDPVMIAKSGDALLADDAVAVLRAKMLPLASPAYAGCFGGFLSDRPAGI